MIDSARAHGQAVQQRLWTKDYVLVLISTHLSFFTYFALAAVLPLYVADRPRWQIGLVAGITGVSSLLARLPAGRLADRFGRRPFLRASALIMAVTLFAHALSSDVWYLVPLRLPLGVAMAVYGSTIMASLTDVMPASRRGEGLAWWGLVYTTTQLYGPALGLLLAEIVGFVAFFGILGVVGLGNFISMLVLAETGTVIADRRGPTISRAALPMLGAFVTLTTAQGAVSTFLVLFTQQAGLGDPKLYLAAFGVAQVVGRWTAGVLADRLGRLSVIVPGMLAVAGAMLLLWLEAGYYLSGLLFGAGFAFGHTGLTILTMDRAPLYARGAALATLTLAWDIGLFLGTIALGPLVAVTGYGAGFAVVGLLPLLGLAVFMPALRGSRVPNDPVLPTPVPSERQDRGNGPL